MIANVVLLLTALTPLMTVLSPVLLAIIAIMASRYAGAAKTRSDIMLAITKDTHTLVNSQYGLALALILEKARRVYELSQDPKDKLEVTLAQKNFDEHQSKQHLVDMSGS